MKLQTIGIFLDKVSGPLLNHFLKKRIGLTEAQIERELAQKYGEIAKHMAENVGEVVKPEAKSIDVGYCLECVPSGTLVYGNSSILKVGTLSCLNYGNRHRVYSHKGRAMPAIKHFSRPYNGELIIVDEGYTNIPLKTTPEHPILAVKNVRIPQTVWQTKGIDESLLEWVPARELSNRDFIAFPRIKGTKDMEIVSGDLAEIFGWYVSEGCYTLQKRGVNITFSLGHHENDRIERVSTLIEKVFGIKPSITTKGTATRINLSSIYWAPIFKQFGSNALEKDIPEWFLHLPEKKQLRFLAGYIGGDGWTSNDYIPRKNWAEITAGTASVKLAYRIRLLLFRLGILHRICLKEATEGNINGRVIKGGPFYEIGISGGSAMRLLSAFKIKYDYKYNRGRRAGWNHGWVGENYVFIPIKSVGKEIFKGRVYNLQIKDDESYLTLHGALHNCCQRHYSKAHGLLEEAERFSLKEGKLTSDAAQKVRKAVEELVTSEDDLDSTQASEGVRKKLNEIKDKMRDIRKKAWGSNLSFEGASLDELRAMKAGVDDLSKRTYNVMGLDKRRFLLSSDGCPSCEMLKRQLSGEIKSGKIIVIDISSDRNFHLAKTLGIEAAPEIVTVSRNSDDTFSVQRENGRTYKLNSWSWWKKPKGGGPRSTSSTRK